MSFSSVPLFSSIAVLKSFVSPLSRLSFFFSLFLLLLYNAYWSYKLCREKKKKNRLPFRSSGSEIPEPFAKGGSPFFLWSLVFSFDPHLFHRVCASSALLSLFLSFFFQCCPAEKQLRTAADVVLIFLFNELFFFFSIYRQVPSLGFPIFASSDVACLFRTSFSCVNLLRG